MIVARKLASHTCARSPRAVIFIDEEEGREESAARRFDIVSDPFRPRFFPTALLTYFLRTFIVASRGPRARATHALVSLLSTRKPDNTPV